MASYVVFSLIAAFSFAFSSLINKFTSKHKISNSWVLLFYYYICYLPSILFIPFIFKISIPTSGWQYIFLYALTFFLGNIFFTKAIYKLDASSIAPFFQLQSAFIALFAYLFLSERFPIQNYFFIGLMLVGAMFITYNEKMKFKSFLQIGVVLIIIQQLLHALSNLFGGFALKQMSSFTVIFWGDLIAASFALLLIPFLGISKLKVKLSQIKPLFLSGIFSTIGATSLFTAFATNLTISSALSLLTSPIVFVFSLVISFVKPDLLEHNSKKVYLIRLFGILLILIGAYKLKMS